VRRLIAPIRRLIGRLGEGIERFGEGRWIAWLGGPPPSLDAPLVERLRWSRRWHMGFFALFYGIGVAGAVIFGAPLWLWVILCVGTVAGISNVVSLSVRIRRERRRV
jgi:hypothetical protein